MERVKTISKYTTNVLGMISAIVLGLNAIEGISIPHATQVVEVIAVFQGIIGSYLVGGKLFKKEEE